jgi:hypothetical protein
MGNISEDTEATLQALQFLIPLNDPFPNTEISYRVIIAMPATVATVKQIFLFKIRFS